jgi:alpha-L-rhamnosidase
MDPLLSWRLEGDRRGLAQTAYRIQAASTEAGLDQPDLWDSDWVSDCRSTGIPYRGKALLSKHRVAWRVRIKDETETESPWSQASWFEVGLLTDRDWQDARWISCTRNIEPQYAPDDLMGPWLAPAEKISGKRLVYSATFTLSDSLVVRAGTWWARAGKGSAWCEVNGQVTRLAKGQNALKFTDFAFDLKPGENEISLVVQGGDLNDAVTMGMRLTFADGREQIVQSSPQWQVHAGRTLQAVKTVCAYGAAPLGRARVYRQAPLAAAWYKRDFEITREPASARLYLCGLGYGEPTLNGRKVGDHVLDPGQSDYEEFAHYQVFDVREHLRSGANTLAVLLGDGWINQDRGFNQMNFVYGKPGLRALLEIRYADGSVQSLVSDRQWAWKASEINLSNIFWGDYVDLRKCHQEWRRPGRHTGWEPVQETDALSPRLIVQDFPPIRCIRALEPVKTWAVGEKTWIVDFGRNISGWISLDLDEPAGTVIRIRSTELLTEDGRHLENVPRSFWWCHGAPQHHEIICDGEAHRWQPRFSYHGFRYAEIHGLGRAPQPGQVRAVVVHTDSPVTATFEASDPLLDRIFRMGVQTHLNNMHSILEDCPQREKCLWGGDLHASWATGYYALDAASFYRQQIRLYYTPPFSKEGIPGNVGVGKRISRSFKSVNWSVSPLFLAWRTYRMHGDLQPARDHYTQMLNFLRFLEKDAPGLIPRQTSPADHAPPAGVERRPADAKLISTLNFYAAATRFADLAEVLGRSEDAAWSRDLARRIHTTLMNRFYDTENKTFGNGTHNSLALAFGVVIATDVNAVAESLARVYRENGQQFDGGFMSYHIYPQLAEHGYVDLALAVLRNPDYPGLAGSIRDYDATTIFETFSNQRERQIERSLDHHATNHASAWLVTHLAGIQSHPDEPGFQRLLLAPHLPRDLDWVRASVRTAYGLIESSWRREGRTVLWTVTVPPNSRAECRIPGAVATFRIDGRSTSENPSRFELKAGTYRLQWEDAR